MCPTAFLHRLSIHATNKGNSIALCSENGEGFSLKFLRWNSTLQWCRNLNSGQKSNFETKQHSKISIMLCSFFCNPQNKKSSADQIRCSITTVCCLQRDCINVSHWSTANNHTGSAQRKKQSHSHSCVGFAELKGVKKTTESYFCPFGKDN